MAPSTILDPYFRVEVISAMSNPQQVVYAAMHQDYSEGFVFDERGKWPDEKRSGELCVKRLLAGERGHYGPIEHTAIVFNCGWFPPQRIAAGPHPSGGRELRCAVDAVYR
jgi:thymidylate synthase (FAD)